MGTSYARQGKYPEAVSAFRTAIRLQAGYWQAYNDLADALLSLSRFDEALEAAAKATVLMPSHPMLYLTLAECYAEKNMDKQAIKALEAAVQKGFSDAGILREDPHLKRFQGHPEFEKLFDLMGISTKKG